MATRDDHYEVLGVTPDASREDIQRAYRRLARRFHPDVNGDPGAAQRFRAVTAAYEVLSDPASRARYDRERLSGQRIPVHNARGYRAGPGPLDIGDLLDGFGFAGTGWATRGADVEAEIEISVEDAYLGGRGQVTLHTAAGVRRCEITVPPGTVDGQRIRLAGRGGVAPGLGLPGDLQLVVRLAPHPRYRVQGRDLVVELAVTPWEAVLGATLPLDTPGGRVQVELPPGSSSGRRLRLAGRGMPNPKGTPGDLYAEVRIVVPEHPTAAERALFERLAAQSRFDPR